MRRPATICLALLSGFLATAPLAAAELGPIELVSKEPAEQAGSASETALSADARYLAFTGAIGGREGVFREDLASGAITPVATASVHEAGAPGGDAHSPSISADGRYISFDTQARLDPIDDVQESSEDVYVADLASSPPSYELASALDGSPHGLTYAGPGGSVASGRVALSADGREVVFVTTAESDLTSGSGGSTEGTPTPAGQVVLRDLTTDRTVLVSGERDPVSGQMEVLGGANVPVPEGAVLDRPQLLPPVRGASLSADGTTVAWLGAHIPAQVSVLPDEAETMEALDALGVRPYDEPLWRRVADGPAAPTRRIVGGGDPLAPGCPAGGSLQVAACQGPFALGGKNDQLNSASGWLGVKVNATPQLSADGWTVALIGNPTEATNLFLVDMHQGLSREQAVRQLTREVPVKPSDPANAINMEPYLALTGHVFDLAISADGQRIAFATMRQQFPLAPPNLVTAPPAQLGLVELYVIDRDGETLRRVTHGYSGLGEASLAAGIANGKEGEGANSPSFGAGGRLLAFSSTASNLVEGDGNGASDAFVVTDAPVGGGAAGAISAGPDQFRHRRRWRLVLSAFRLPHGRVRLVAVVPGAGTLRGRVTTPPDSAGKRPRRLARVRRRARRARTLRIVLTPPRRLRRLTRQPGGLAATARVSFHSRGHRTLHGTVQLRFLVHGKRGGRK